MGKTATRSFTLLVVDDEPGLRDIIALHFRMLGYEVLEAADGREALSLLLSNPVDLVLSDVRMPGLDGIALLTALKESRPEVPIVLMTGYSQVDEAEAFRLGAEGLIAKPFGLVELDETVERVRNSHARRRTA